MDTRNNPGGFDSFEPASGQNAENAGQGTENTSAEKEAPANDAGSTAQPQQTYYGAPPAGDAQRPVNSFTPNANKFAPTGQYGGFYQYPQPPVQPVYNAPKPPKKKKEKKHGLGAVVAIALACSVICSGASAAITLAVTDSNDSNERQQIVKTINVDESATNLVEAIASKCINSVVGIRTTLSYRQFFGSQEATGEGSGVVFSADGYIVTNYHVISGSSSSSNYGTSVASTIQVEVYLNDSDEAYQASIVGYNKSCDLAVLKINASGLTPIEFADSDELKVGQTAVAIGSPGGLDFINSVSSGIVSGVNRSITVENVGTMTLIQTDAAINPGNSGGALVDASGKLIGINNVKISSSDYEGMGFAIPSNTVKEMAENIIANKDTEQHLPYLGLQIYNISAADLKAANYPAGAVVGQVVQGGPCDGLGIEQYDIITEFNGNKLNSYDDLENYKNSCKPGDTVELTLYRYTSDDYYTISVTLGEATN